MSWADVGGEVQDEADEAALAACQAALMAHLCDAHEMEEDRNTTIDESSLNYCFIIL